MQKLLSIENKGVALGIPYLISHAFGLVSRTTRDRDVFREGFWGSKPPLFGNLIQFGSVFKKKSQKIPIHTKNSGYAPDPGYL